MIPLRDNSQLVQGLLEQGHTVGVLFDRWIGVNGLLANRRQSAPCELELLTADEGER